jgi:hypothetical protein
MNTHKELYIKELERKRRNLTALIENVLSIGRDSTTLDAQLKQIDTELEHIQQGQHWVCDVPEEPA